MYHMAKMDPCNSNKCDGIYSLLLVLGSKIIQVMIFHRTISLFINGLSEKILISVTHREVAMALCRKSALFWPTIGSFWP